MKQIEWHKIDLNLLKVLRVLGEENNTQRVAQRLFVSQSAISKSLQKLRVIFDDELFIRQQHGLTPTPTCIDIVYRLNGVFESLESLIEPTKMFDPTLFNKDILISINPMLYQPLIERLYPRLRKASPNATIHFSNWSWGTENDLSNCKVNLGVNFSPLDLSKFVRNKPTCKAKFQMCCNKGSQMHRQRVSFDTLSQVPLVFLVMPDYANYQSIGERYLTDRGVEVKVAARSDQLDMCLDIVKFDDGALPVSSLVAYSIDDDQVLMEFPDSIQLPEYHISSYTAYSNRNNSMIQWLENEVSEVVKELNEQL